MAYEMKDGSANLFKNDRKESEKHPDYTGSIMINGREHYFSAWIKEGKKGKFISLVVMMRCLRTPLKMTFRFNAGSTLGEIERKYPLFWRMI
jgi:hypothetical protein